MRYSFWSFGQLRHGGMCRSRGPVTCCGKRQCLLEVGLATSDDVPAVLRVIHTGGDGRLISSTSAEIEAIVEDVAQASRVVLHFHGGLVNEKSGWGTARRLNHVYEQAGALPVFFVWRSGLLETVTGNLREIFVEDLFQRLLGWVLRFSVGKLRDRDGARGIWGIDPPPRHEVDRELDQRRQGQEPFRQDAVSAGVPALSATERADFERRMARDRTLADELAAILGAEPDAGARSGESRPPALTSTRMSSTVIAELARDQPGPDARSLVSTALLVRKSAAALERVIKRFRAGTDHGAYPTVVEELLREFYLANLGGAVWAAMKADTGQTFEAAAEARGGRMFLDRLSRALSRPGAARPEFTLVGHSTGAVFIDNMITDLATSRARGEMPADVRVRNVAFLAPACTIDHFADVLEQHGDIVERFRMFTMNDEAERADRLVGAFYPRSLLYLVSGLLERDLDGVSECVPLTGLARYLQTSERDPGDSVPKNVALVRDFLAEADQQRVVWSPAPPGAPGGMRSQAVTHGAFDDDESILASLQHMIAGADA